MPIKNEQRTVYITDSGNEFYSLIDAQVSQEADEVETFINATSLEDGVTVREVIELVVRHYLSSGAADATS